MKLYMPTVFSNTFRCTCQQLPGMYECRSTGSRKRLSSSRALFIPQTFKTVVLLLKSKLQGETKFDWAGKAGEVVYPDVLNPSETWAPGAKVGVCITKNTTSS